MRKARTVTKVRTRELMMEILEAEYVFEKIDRKRLEEYLKNLVESDPSYSENVFFFNQYFGFGATEQPLSLGAIAAKHGVTVGHASQKMKRVTRHLRKRSTHPLINVIK